MSEDLDRLSARWNYPTSVRFGVGRIAELARACKGLGMSRPLLVTDPGLAALPMDERATLTNMATECSARGAIVEADVATYEWSWNSRCRSRIDWTLPMCGASLAT